MQLDPTILSRLNLRQKSAGGYEIVIPAAANMAADGVGRHARGERRDHPALIFEQADGSVGTWTFAALDEQATRLAAFLRSIGIQRGDRIAVHSGNRPETGLAHLAIYKLGAIAVTLSQLYGPETIRHIFTQAEPAAIITQAPLWRRFRALAREFPTMRHHIVIGDAEPGEIPFAHCLATPADSFTIVETSADDPALLLFTSGSTGLPKGLLHAHRILHAYLPTLALIYNLEIDRPGNVFWTPADWAWVGGLLDLVLPAWAHGQTVVTSEHRFESAWALDFMARRGVTHTFMTPTALRRLTEVASPREDRKLALRVVCTGGESLPGETLRWIERELGVVCNEFYGLTEVNHLVGCCQRLFPSLPGSMGCAYPGHGTTLVDEAGNELPPGEVGEIVARADDPTRFLGYWNNPSLDDHLRLGPWLRTRDLAVRDEQGYFWYRGRADDLIKSAGYRIGPTEVEDMLLRHPLVAEAAVIGVPDPARGQIVKAYVRLREGAAASPELARELQQYVKDNLAAYKYPREIEFVKAFVLTSTGKINRRTLREAG